MWIVCLEDNLHEMLTYYLWKIDEKNLKMLSAAVVIGTLRVTIQAVA